MEASEQVQEYFRRLEKETHESYEIAGRARKKGFDPEKRVDIPVAKGVAQRVEGLISAVAPQIMKSGVAERIIELETEYGSLDWRVALKIAEEVAKQKFCKFDDTLKSMETGIRVGLAYITLGVISAPLEGFIELKIKKRKDGKDYLSAFYAGPIRAAGGTAEAVSIIITDYVRLKMGYSAYDPTEKEIKRTIAEIQDYHERVTNLQYRPSEEELKFLLENLPIEINGDPTEEMEVSNYKDLERVETNRIRGGICLVLAEGLAQKAPKVNKRLKNWGTEMGLSWEFLTEFLEIQKRVKAKAKEDKKTDVKITPNYTYIKDLVAGRPVLAFPMAQGGLRLRYGRTRLTGLAAAAVHPQTMVALNSFIAQGTQLKMERPGKAAGISVCDTIEPPILKLKDGSVIRAGEKFKINTEDIEKILYLGDILFNYGDFSENGHKLVPVGYCEEWWAKEVDKKSQELFGSIDHEKIANMIGADISGVKEIFKSPTQTKVTFRLALKFSKLFGVPLHPSHTPFWTAIKNEDLAMLFNYIDGGNVKQEEGKIKKIILRKALEKEILEKIGLPHLQVNNEFVVIENENAEMMHHFFYNKGKVSIDNEKSVLENLSQIAGIKIKDKAGTFIGARMGRPEKAKMRKLQGSPHFLFPVGEEGGRMRSILEAKNAGKVTAEFPLRTCKKCSKETIYQICETCGEETEKLYYCWDCSKRQERDVISEKPCEISENGKKHESKTYKRREVKVGELFESALKMTNSRIFPDLIKGVKGASNKEKVPEHMVKGILRAKHDIYVNKDGTTRYDMIEMPITHFTPKEIGTPFNKIKELGYTKDIYGKDIIDDNQIIEIFPQDVILAAAPDSTDEASDDVLFRVANFIDELLIVLYGEKPFYNLRSKKDLVGHLIIGLAPHTSAGTVGRIIGFSKTQGMLTHPLYHAAMRRNCDGDESCALLLMDSLLNFSRSFLPDKRGSRTMDAPLVLTSILIPGEVDDEVHGMDIVWDYPLELYEAAEEYKNPWDVEIRQIGNVLGTPEQYEGMGYTHIVTNINKGVLCSAYKTLPTMEDKLKGQMDLAEKINAVSPTGVAELVIEKHFLKDIKGNLRKFSTQQFRCVNCNEKYRRPPLRGKCIVCNGKIIFTISKGSITKYVQPTISMAEKYGVKPYLMQSIDILSEQIDSVLGKEKEIQEGLGKWF